MPYKLNSGILITLTLVLSNLAFARIVEDPILDFVSQENLSSGDVVYKIEADLNEDSINDILLSSSSNERIAGKAGVSWQEYLSTPEGFFTPDIEEIRAGISMPIDGVVLKRLPEVDNSIAFVSFFSSSAGRGSIVAYYVDQTNRIKLYHLGSVNIHEAYGNDSDREKFSAFMSGGIEYKKQTIPKDKILIPSVKILNSDTLKEKNNDFYNIHNFVSDPIGGNRQLVYRKSDNKLVGYLENGLVFVPLAGFDKGSGKIIGDNPTVVPQLQY